MNILVVHEADYIDQVVFEYQIIPELLASCGHNVYVIDYSSDRKNKGILDLVSLKTKYFYDVRKSNKKKGVTLIRPGVIKIQGLGRMSAFFTHFFAIRNTIKKYNINRIILYSVPTNGLQTVFWAKRYNIPILFRLLDVLHQLVPYKLYRFPIYLIEKVVYRLSDELLAVTPRVTKYAIDMGSYPKTTSYLPSGADSDLFRPGKKNHTLLNKYGLTKKDLIIFFAGTLYNFSGLDEIILKIPQYLEKIPNMKLLIVGRGKQESQLRRIIRSLNLEKRVILAGFKPYEELPNYINLSDVGINPFHINAATNSIFPGKIYQYLACGKPTMATKLQGMIDIFPINDSKSGIYYFDTIEEFFKLTPEVCGKKAKDSNPSLQKITKIIEQKLESMKI